MADQVFTDFYRHVFKALSADPTISAAVAAQNIRPSNDPIEPTTGPVIYYSWSSSQWIKRRKRGQGTFNITVASEKNKRVALQLMEQVREVLQPRTLRDADNKVIPSKFEENEALTDDAIGLTERFEVSTSFDVKLIKAA